MGTKRFLCHSRCLTGVLLGQIFGRKAEELLCWVSAVSPIGTGPLLPLKISKITCEPIPTAQMLKVQRCGDAPSGTNHCLLLRLSPPVVGGC